MKDQRLLRMDGEGPTDGEPANGESTRGELVEVADLSGLATHFCNDMVMSASGHAYVGNFGFDLEAGADPVATCLIHVSPDGAVSVAADDVMFPNGTVITPDGDTLILAETFASRLTAFRIEADGSLTERRVWAPLGDGIPDGICLDAEGAIWVADPRANEVFRVLEGGEVTDRITTGDLGAFACMLGGADRRTLYVCTAAGSGSAAAGKRSGRIEQVRVEVPGDGLP